MVEHRMVEHRMVARQTGKNANDLHLEYTTALPPEMLRAAPETLSRFRFIDPAGSDGNWNPLDRFRELRGDAGMRLRAAD
jgi:hypothetical protein